MSHTKKTKEHKANQQWTEKMLMLLLADSLIILISYFIALLLRFDFVFSSIPEGYLTGYLWSMPFWIISTVVVFYICRLYHSIWRLASVAELQMILIAYAVLAVVYSVGMLFMEMRMPRSYYFIGFLLSFLLTTGMRFSYRILRFYINSSNTELNSEKTEKEHIMVIGAGAAGQALIKEIINSDKLDAQVVCIIDDNPTKYGRILEGITIVGDRYQIPEMVKKYRVSRIIYAIPAASPEDRKAILNICKDTDFVAVRFGNVLGSNGSVIPLFKKQIAEGGPVTVTDKNIIRYFMTIPEAVSLVLQAAHYAKGGEIFILDMGEPVRIDEMARNLIRLSGFTPDVDIKVEYTGLRPGEKLFEELLMAEEGMQDTPNKLIHIGKPIEMDDAAFKKKLRQLDEAAYQETDRMRKLVAEVVPTYHPENAGNA